MSTSDDISLQKVWKCEVLHYCTLHAAEGTPQLWYGTPRLIVRDQVCDATIVTFIIAHTIIFRHDGTHLTLTLAAPLHDSHASFVVCVVPDKASNFLAWINPTNNQPISVDWSYSTSAVRRPCEGRTTYIRRPWFGGCSYVAIGEGGR